MIKRKISLKNPGKVFSTFSPLISVLLFTTSYYGFARLASFQGTGSAGNSPGRFSSMGRFARDITSSREEVLRALEEINKKFREQSKIKGEELFSPSVCHREEKLRKEVKKTARKGKKVALHFSFNLTVQVTAVAGSRRFTLINGRGFTVRAGKVINCGDGNRCYIRILKIAGGRVKVYVAPANYRNRGKVVWLKRGENAVKLSFSV